jgi:hypothetical protein
VEREGAGAESARARLRRIAALWQRLTALEQRWIFPDQREDGDDGDGGFVAWAGQRFGVQNPRRPVDLADLEKRWAEALREVVWLHHRFMEEDLVGPYDTETLQTSARFTRLYQLITYTYYVFEGYRRCRTAGQSGVLAAHLTPYTMEFRFRSLEPAENTPFQNLLIFLLQELERQGLRRYHSKDGQPACYRQIVVRPDPEREPDVAYETHAWEYECELSDFVYRTARKEIYFSQWANLTANQGNAAGAVKYLGQCCDPEFPPLRPDRHVFAFRNGIYDARQNLFWRYGRDPVPHDLVACRFFDLEFPAHLTDVHDAYEEIPTPHFQAILDSQALLGSDAEEHRQVCFWIYAMVGRLLYDVGEQDKWQVMPFIKGRANTGKSTLLRHAVGFYNTADIGVLSSNVEDTFGLQNIYYKYVWVCYEVKEDFRLHQGDWQSMVTGEEVSVAVKFKSPVVVQWRSPGILGGNEDASWVDTQGSVTRRLLVIEFTHIVARADPLLPEKLDREMAHLLLKCNLCYRSAVRMFGNCNFWDIPTLPRYFHATRQRLSTHINPLEGFITDPEKVVLCEGRYVPLALFKSNYFAWLRENGRRASHSPDLYRATFETHNIREKFCRLLWDGKEKEATFLINVALKGVDFDLCASGDIAGDLDAAAASQPQPQPDYGTFATTASPRAGAAAAGSDLRAGRGQQPHTGPVSSVP